MVPIVLDHGKVHEREQGTAEQVIEVAPEGMGGELGLDGGRRRPAETAGE